MAVDVVRVGQSVLRYKGGTGQWAWAIHRAAGLGVLAFLALHIADIFVAAFGPGLFNDLLFLYKGPLARVGEIFLAFGLLYHALNGLRIILQDFAPRLASLKTARRLFWLQMILFLALFIPASYFMMITLPPDSGLHDNIPAALLVTFGILAIPGVIAFGAQLIPEAANTRLDSDESQGNYQDALNRIILSRQRRPMNRLEINIWLFIRVSGFLLIALALFHMFWLHFVISVEDITFNTIVQRWQDPVQGWFWRTYDFSLLVFAFTHGMLGARYSIEDYVHSLGLKRLLYLGAWATFIALILMGVFIIFFFNGKLA
jgi:succinate dehydrogenase / fumarate reductase cytochrome b subunit